MSKIQIGDGVVLTIPGGKRLRFGGHVLDAKDGPLIKLDKQWLPRNTWKCARCGATLDLRTGTQAGPETCPAAVRP